MKMLVEQPNGTVKAVDEEQVYLEMMVYVSELDAIRKVE